MIAQERGDFMAGAAVVVEAMLQSPRFLMRAEEGGGPLAGVRERVEAELLPVEHDSRRLAAGRGRAGRAGDRRADRAGRAEDARRPARQASDGRVPGAVDALRPRARDDSRSARVRELHAGDGGGDGGGDAPVLSSPGLERRETSWSLFTADYVFPDAQLAEIYGLPAPAEPFTRVDLPADSPRAGVLGQGTFLTLTSKPADSSPTARGLFVREHFLCQAVPPPPPGVNAALPPLTDAKPMTNRERLAVHLSNEACASCHRLIDPIGYGFEHFDAIGRYRATHDVKIPPTRDEQKRKLKTETTEYQLEIDSSAEVVGVAGSEFSSPKELGQVLAKDEGCQKCVVKQLFRYALGRPETLADRRAIDGALETFRDSRYRFRELIISIVTSEPFLGGTS